MRDDYSARQSSVSLPSCSEFLLQRFQASTSDEPAMWRSTAAAPPPWRRRVPCRRSPPAVKYSGGALTLCRRVTSRVRRRSYLQSAAPGGDEAPLCNHGDLRAAQPGEHILQGHVHLSGTLRFKLLFFFSLLPSFC